MNTPGRDRSLGSQAMFDHLLSKAGKTFWVYGGLTCKMYPVKHLEVGGVRKGALEYIVDGGHVRAVDGHLSARTLSLHHSCRSNNRRQSGRSGKMVQQDGV